MNFNNKKYIIIAAAIIGLILVASIFVGKSKTAIFPAINAVPEKAIIILETENLPQLLSALKDDINLFSMLSQSSMLNQSYRDLFAVDSVFTKNKDLNNFFNGRKIIISSHIVSKKENAVILISPSESGDAQKIQKIISKFSNKKYLSSTEKYDTEEITSVWNIKYPDEKIYFSFCDGYFLMSWSNILLQNSIRRISSNYNLTKDKNFNELYGYIKSESIAKIFINYDNLLKSAGNTFNERELKKYGFIYNFAEWTGLDLTVSDKKIEMSGYTVTKQEAQYLNIFKEIEPENSDLLKVLPKKVSSFFIVNINNGITFHSKYETYLAEIKKIKQHRALIEKFYKIFELNKKEDDFYSHISDEIAFANEDINKTGQNHNTFCFIKTNDSDFYGNFFDKMNKNYCAENNSKPENYIEKFTINDEEYKIYKLHTNKIPSIFFGTFFDYISAQYASILNNYVIFSENPSSLRELINQYNNEQTFAEHSDDLSLIKSVSDETNLFFYTNLFHNKNIYKKFLKPQYSQNFENDSKLTGKIKGPVIQYISDSYPIYTTISFEIDNTPPAISETVWETKLDSNLVASPHIVTNHNTDEKEIFLQDSKNKIYLIDKYGNILWKRQLSEKIIGNVSQIDYFQNNKLQIIFNTKNEIHAFDRNGNYVENFPVKLKSPASTGITVVDYDNDRNYRIFVACENKKVYLYNKEAKIVDGWNFRQTKYTVTNDIKHFSAFQKDYIVFNDISNLYIVDRKGDTRIKPLVNFPIGKNSEVYLDIRETEKDTRFVVTNPKGTIYFVYLDGNVKKMEIEEYSDLHYFNFFDLNGDKIPEFIFTDNNQTDVYRFDKKRLFSYTYSEKAMYNPRIFKFSETNIKLGLTSANGKIYLINNNGTVVKGFPIIGNSPYRIAKFTADSEYSIIVAGRSNYIYKYNVL